MEIDQIISPSIGFGRVEVTEVTSFLLLNHLLENADIFCLRNFNSEELFWIIIEKQAVERECRQRRKLEGVCSTADCNDKQTLIDVFSFSPQYTRKRPRLSQLSAVTLPVAAVSSHHGYNFDSGVCFFGKLTNPLLDITLMVLSSSNVFLPLSYDASSPSWFFKPLHYSYLPPVMYDVLQWPTLWNKTVG